MPAEVRQAIDRAVDYATSELSLVLGSSPITQLIPVRLIAELAAATILGIEVFQQNGREIDLDQVAVSSLADAGVSTVGPSRSSGRLLEGSDEFQLGHLRPPRDALLRRPVVELFLGQVGQASPASPIDGCGPR